MVAASAEVLEEFVDLNRLVSLSAPPSKSPSSSSTAFRLQPLGQRIAIGMDDAFCFVYPHLLRDWQAQGAEILPFSPLADESARMDSDAAYWPGGYPELHGGETGMPRQISTLVCKAAKARNALIYGECGGYMVLGETLTDKPAQVHRMSGLLPISTDISRPRRTLGYRRLRHRARFPGPPTSWATSSTTPPAARQTRSSPPPTPSAPQLPPMGAVAGRVMGSYAHVIDVA